MSSKIHPSAVIDAKAELGVDVIVGPNCVVDEGTVIGDGTILDANVTIGKDVVIGKGNSFFANSVIGRPPQLLGLNSDTKFGKLTIGDNNTIREMVTIHPSMYPDKTTSIGNANLLMIGMHIGHDCVLEDNIVMSNYTQLSGHCKVETGVWFAGVVLVHQFVTVGKWSYAAGLSGINHDVPPFVMISGHYPSEVRSINKRGLDRAGYDAAEQKNILKAFKRIYKSDEGVFSDRVNSLAAETDLDEGVRSMVDSIKRSNEHRFGRHLELFR
jgi:UDP-N-acetylglucosamine acyltransferase